MDELILQSNQDLSNPLPGVENNGFLDIVSPLQTTRGNVESLRPLPFSAIEAEQNWSNIVSETLSYSPIFGFQLSAKNSVAGQLFAVAQATPSTISISASDATAAETIAGLTANPGIFTLTRTGNIASSLAVNYTISGTATNGTDYQTLTNSVTFAEGLSTAIINVTPSDDTVFEGNETVILNLSSSANYGLGTAKTATVNLVDNDKPTITLSATDASAGETLTGQTANPGRFTLTRTGNKTAALTVNYSLAGTATNGTDYNTLTKTVTFAAGSSTAIIDVTVKDDAVYEGNETAIVTLASGTSYILGTAKTATVNLVDNDKPTITISATDVSAAETVVGETANPGRFTLTRTGNKTAALTVSYSVAGTATNGTDYNSLTGTATFAAGSATALIDVNVKDDVLSEGNETVIVTLASGTSYILGTAKTATVNLVDNDSSTNVKPTITISASDVNAGETLTGQTANPGKFTLTRTGSTASSLTVNYSVAGTANNGIDYNNLSGTATFAAGSSTAIINLTPIDDSLVEGDETVVLSFAANTNYVVGNLNSATITITDNDKLSSKTDLIHFDNPDSLHVWLANGDGTFTVKPSYTPWNGYWMANNNYNFKTGDFNGDGKTDLIHFASNDYVHVWLANGDGTFTVKPGFTPATGYAIGSNNYNFKTGDFNGDGKTDLIHFDNPDSLHVWLANGDGTFTVKPSYTPWNGYWMANNNYNFKTGDFNGDGKTDLIHFVSNDYVHVWLANGDGTFTVKPGFTPATGYAIGSNNYNFKTGDFNGDGKTDLIHFDNPDSLHVWLANGDGTFTVKPSYTPWNGYWMANNNYNFKTGDFNGDGKTDLIHFVSNDYVHVWLANGDGTFTVKPGFTPATGYAIGSNNYNFKTGDFNGDGKTDLIHFDNPDSLHVWLANGDGTFTVKPSYTPWNGYLIAGNRYYFKTGDFNGDGNTTAIYAEDKDSAFVQPYDNFGDPNGIANSWNASYYFWNGQGTPIIDDAHRIGTVNLGSSVRGDGQWGMNFQNWGAGSPAANVPADNFAMHAYTRINFTAGHTYKVWVRSDDGYRMWAHKLGGNPFNITDNALGGTFLSDAYGSKEFTFVAPESGTFDFHAEMFEGGGNAYFDLAVTDITAPPPPPPSNPDIDIRLDFTYSGFNSTQIALVEQAAQNWERIITRDMVPSGFIDIVVTQGSTTQNGSQWNGTWAATDFPYGIGTIATPNIRYNLNTQMRFNSGVLPTLSNNQLVRLAMHELGHALYLDEAQNDSLLGMDSVMDLYGLDARITEGVYQRLEYLGYRVDRNATVYWS